MLHTHQPSKQEGCVFLALDALFSLLFHGMGSRLESTCRETELASEFPGVPSSRVSIYSIELQGSQTVLTLLCAIVHLTVPASTVWVVSAVDTLPLLQIRLIVLMMSLKREAPLLCSFVKLKVPVLRLCKDPYSVTSLCDKP